MAVVDAVYSLATPGVKAPKVAGAPSVSASVAGTCRRPPRGLRDDRQARRRGGREVARPAELLLERVAEAEHLRVVPRAADELQRHRVAVRVRADRQDQRRQADVGRRHAAVAVAESVWAPSLS